MEIIVQDEVVVIVMSTREARGLDLGQFDRRLFDAVGDGSGTKEEDKDNGWT